MTKRMTPERYAECLGGDDVDPVDLFKIAMAQAHAEGLEAGAAMLDGVSFGMEREADKWAAGRDDSQWAMHTRNARLTRDAAHLVRSLILAGQPSGDAKGK